LLRPKGMTRLIRILISLVLVAVFAAIQPCAVVAANEETYISELVIETGSSAAEAKAKLTDNGYTVYDKNISNTSNDTNTSGYMYIGYKTTSDPNEAITDIRVMNMGGGYSYAEYEQLIEQKIQLIGAKIDALMVSVGEYRTNYNANKESAKFAREMLNKLVEDDSGLLMGDYLLDTTKTRDEYIDLFMQCSTAVYVTIYKALAIGCVGSGDKVLTDLAGIDNEDLIGETQYDAIASDIYDSLPLVQSALAPYALSGVTTADGATADDIDAAYEGLTDEEKATWNDSFAFAYILESISLSGGDTLYDLLMTDLNELTNEDLYALASVFSPGQAALIRTAGLKDVITVSMVKQDKWSEMYSSLVTLAAPISVYTGVDRSLFDGGVALTSKAMVEAAANADKEWFGSEMDNDTEEIFYKIITISFFAAAGAAALYLTSTGMFNWIGSSISKMVLTQEYCNGINFGGSWAAPYILSKMYMEAAQTIMLYVSQLMTYGFWIAIGVLLITSCIFLYCSGYAYYHPVYDETPRILVEKITDASEETQYINYYSVKDLSGKIIDVNQHDASKWVTLYCTKDANAGKPVLANLQFSNSNVKEGYDGICRFSEKTPFNINQYSYNYFDRILRDGKSDFEIIESLYLYMQHSTADVAPSSSGSVFTRGSIVIGAVALVLGAIGGYVAGKKKKKPAIA